MNGNAASRGASPASLLIRRATLIDGVAEKEIEEQSIWITSGRIQAIAPSSELDVPLGAAIIEARGKFVIPGLMNANVHLFCDTHIENVVRYEGRYEELIAEAAQVALRNGLTTVFDTGGPRRFLTRVRDEINNGKILGSRIFCAGWIVGFDGPYSEDFFSKVSEVASPALVKRINSIWAENVGRHLMWQPPERVALAVRAYLGTGIDFLKYASNDHFPGAFLAFSPQAQALIVEEAHRAGTTAQAHTTSVEGLRIAIEAGCDLIQHANITGPVPIPEATLDLLARQKTGAVVFPLSAKALDWLKKNGPDKTRTAWAATDVNARNLIKSGAPLLMANDGLIFAPQNQFEEVWAEFYSLSEGHFAWFAAMEEKGCPPMQMLQAATRNIAEAYGKDSDLGTLEPGKIADLLILDKNPLQAAENYRSIHSVIKDGAVVNTEALPVNAILTRPVEPPAEEEASYVPFLGTGSFPAMYPMCVHRRAVIRPRDLVDL